ncbi:sulfotransferase [Nonomuraea sp. K274]|uniref:Sulfotransferase n=1 Tax=Nonomuraea cypriaca TaxID=1187855 RepID=A0A931A6C6_9ACTN|nr:sulfotransferase [Nonomuraea cypriaca]MBF8184180.1 sulfotransferase [Nonomuraea cypriaca]
MRRVQIVGTQRSGSNLLRLLLGSLPGVFAPPSAHKLRDFQDLTGRYGSLRAPSNQGRLAEDMGRLVDVNALAWPRIPDRRRAILAEMGGSMLAHAVLAFYDAHARHFGKQVWVSKCLENVHFIDQLFNSGLPILYLHLVRDPRDVAASFSRAPIGPKEPKAIALRWLEDQKAAMTARGMVGEDHWLTVRYEDLVTDPEAALAPLCDRAGLRWSATALEFYRQEEARSAASISELWNNLDRPIRRDRVSAYKRSANTELVTAVEGITCDLMSAFDYAAEYIFVPTGISAGENEDILNRDREMRAESAAARDPEAEAVHLRRLRFLEDLKAMRSPKGFEEDLMYVQFAQKAVIEWQGRLLLIRKSQDDPYQPGKWELPGGRMKPDESPDDALVREVREEVGLDVSPGRPLALWSWRLGSEQDAPTVIAVARLCKTSAGDVDMSRNDEDDFIEKYGWFERDEVLDLDLIPSARGPIATVLANL